jgi:AAA domain
MSNPKKIDLVALLQDDDAPTNPRTCCELGCGNFVQADDEFCAEHTGKQAVEAGRFPGPEKRSDRRGQPVEEGGRAMSDEKYTRAEVMAVINPEGKVPEKGAGPTGKLTKCIYCSDHTDDVFGLGVTCFNHADEKWREHDRKKVRTVVSKQPANKRRTMQSAMRERQDEEQFNGKCRGGCGEMISGEYVCYDCRTKKQREALTLKPGEKELYRGNIGDPEDKIIKQVVVINAAEGDIGDTEWLWLNKIPLGSATWCMGQPGNAKSLMTTAITACVTTGKDFPDGSKNTVPPSRVLMYCGEDSISKVVKPRLLAHGADLTKVSFLDRKSFRTIAGDAEPEKRPLDLSQDCDVLLAVVKANPDIKLIIADPITGIFGNKNINKNEEVDPIFQKLIDFCEASGIAFLGVLHVPKRQTNNAIEKVAGGTAVSGSAKSAFMLTRDPDSEDKHEHLLTMVKWNYASNWDGIKYKTVPAVASWKGKTSNTVVIEWGEVIHEIADDVLVKQNSKGAERDRQIDKCEAFLKTYLTKGPVRSPDVYDSAKTQGFSAPTVQRALKNIGGHHIDRRAQHQGFWMSLTPDFPAPQPELLMSVGAGQEL